MERSHPLPGVARWVISAEPAQEPRGASMAPSRDEAWASRAEAAANLEPQGRPPLRAYHLSPDADAFSPGPAESVG